MSTFPCLRGDLTLAPDCAQQHVEALLPRCRTAFDLEDRMRQSLDLGLQALDKIGQPVDDRFQQTSQDNRAALEIGLGTIAPRDVNGKCTGLGIAHRYEPLPGEDER